MNEETVIVGDASGCFLYRSADSSRDNHADMNLDAVALVFARDKHKSDGTSWFLCIQSNNIIKQLVNQ